jgi:hypothetical protein
MTLTTFSAEEALSHGHFPGPPGSDRAWELVSEPDTSGNPVGRSFAPTAASISDDGNRAVYGVAGGTPLSETGTFATRLFAERTPSGWQTKKIYPSREEATGPEWENPGGPSDLSTLVTENHAQVQGREFSIWRLFPDAPPERLYANPDDSSNAAIFIVSGDGSRVLDALIGTQDPEHPVTPGATNLYDISSGSSPKLIDLLPDGSVPTCGVARGDGLPSQSPRSIGWISDDGSLAFFPSQGSGSCSAPLRLYLREFNTETTKLISTPPVSGPECDSHLIKAIPGFAFFFTESRLVPEDAAPASCAGRTDGDIYRYDLSDGALHCITCAVPDRPAAVEPLAGAGSPGLFSTHIGISEDGSRIYFNSNRRLLPGAAPKEGTYRLDVASGELAYVGSLSTFLSDHGESAMSADGSVVVFRSAGPSLNALGGQQNGGGYQYYRYDDRDRSLICVSCPTDGSLPKGEVTILEGSVSAGGRGQGANKGQSLDADGEDFAFATSTPLVAADQNTAGPGQNPEAGTDVYEWRGGRFLLVSDGLTNWPAGEVPRIAGITPSGRDLFFSEAAQLTQDALDGYNRLYDARIGGGIEFPPPPRPCPLEVCQGTPKGAPEEQAPGSAFLQGSGNAVAHKAHKAKKHAKKKHPKKKAHKRAKHNRRAAR